MWDSYVYMIYALHFFCLTFFVEGAKGYLYAFEWHLQSVGNSLRPDVQRSYMMPVHIIYKAVYCLHYKLGVCVAHTRLLCISL